MAPQINYVPLFLGVLLIVLPSALGQGCDVIFSLNPPQSNFTLGGAVTKPIASPFEPGNQGVLSGIQGDLVATLPAPCPADAAGLVAALATAQFTTSPITGALQFYPSQVTVTAGSLATLQWTDIFFNATLSLANSQGTLTLTISDGWTNSTSLLSPNGERVELIGVTGTNSSQAIVSTENGEVFVTLPGLTITMPSTYFSTLGGQPLEGGTDYVLMGSIVMQAAVGCPGSCGANGRCAAADDGTLSCQCECGWGGADCSIPSGFCTRFATEAGAAATCPVLPPTPTPTPAPPSQSTGCGASQCSIWEQWNSTAATCSCKEGWGGPFCDACQSNSACSSFFSDAAGEQVTATCSNSRLYTSDTAHMAYTCELEGSGLDGVLEPGSFSVGCNTTTGSVAGGATVGLTPTVSEGSYCRVDFALLGRADNAISCKASLCAFRSNSSTVNCQATSCSCASSCPDLKGVFDRIEGQPCVIDCDESGECVFDIKDFFVTLKAPCTNQACLVDGFTMEEGAYTYSPDKDYNPLIAAIPLIALLSATAVFTTYLLMNRSFFKAVSSRGVAAKSAAAGVATVASPPVQSIRELAFSDLTSTVRMRRKETKVILSRVSGVAHVGELVGVLGPSGGGKTSLLSVLAGSVEDTGHSVTISGSVTLDGHPLDASLARRVAYCPQDSTLLPTLTVEECVRYSALLRLPRETSAPEVAAVVTNVIDELGLRGVAGSLVGGGSGLRGVSGGERKRVTIAMELVTNPSVLILDEPTSGLDSFTAYSMMSTLKSVANSGRIVMLSFHQPSPAMFSLLDRCFLLAQGRCVFTGPPAAVETHFANIKLPKPEGVGAAEHMLFCACDPESLPALLASADADPLADAPKLPPSAHSGSSSEDTETGLAGSPNTAEGLAENKDSSGPVTTASRRTGAGLSRELALLFWRAFIDIIRNPTLLLLHWGMGLGMGIFVGCIFWGVGTDISGAQDRLGGVFFALAFFAFTSLTTVDLIMTERRLVSREVRGGYYRPGSYLATKAVLDALLLRAVPVFLYSAAFYPMMGLVGGSVHVALWLMCLATFAVAVGALSLAVAVGSRTPGRASLIMNIVLLLSLLVGGFFVNTSTMQDWISWLHYLSVFFYAYAALTTNELSSVLLNFEVEGYTAVQNVRGTTFLEIIGINPKKLTVHIIVLDCMYVAFLLLAFALLYWKMPRAHRLRQIRKAQK